MHLGRTAQVLVFMVVWAATLVAVDKTLNHTPPTVPTRPGHGKPQVMVTFTHFCCSGCYDKMFSAAKALSWIVTATTDRSGMKKQEDLQKEKVDEATAIETLWQKDATLQLDETDLKSVDLVKLSTTFRDAGLVPRRISLENIPHFRLIAVDLHLCCGLCEGAARNSMKMEETRVREQAKKDNPTLNTDEIAGQFMPHFEVDRSHESISAEYYQKADVTGFRQAMERAGFSPREIRIEVL